MERGKVSLFSHSRSSINHGSSLSSIDKFPSISTALGSSSIEPPSSKGQFREHFLQRPVLGGRSRGTLDCFGIEDEDVDSLQNIFSRTSLRTPPEVREFILKEKREKEERLNHSLNSAKIAKYGGGGPTEKILDKGSDKEVVEKKVGFGRTMSTSGKGTATKLDSSVQPQPTAKSIKDSKRLTGGGEDIYDVRKGVAVVDEQSKFFFSEEERERKQRSKEEKQALLSQRKEKAMIERSMKMAKAMSVKLSQKDLMDREPVDEEFEKVKHQYIGEGAREDFLNMFHSVTSEILKYPEFEDLPVDKRTPHSAFLREQTKRHLTPLPLILRSEANPKGIFLANKGLGDDRVLPIIMVLETLPAVQKIDLSDNRLTDKSLMPLARQLPLLTSLTHLDLSFNKIDESSETIMSYLRASNCKLRVLLLNGADVDDGECCNLMDAITCNRSIETLGLSRNLIGKAETLNTVYPDLTTGGESIAQLLLFTKTLRSLDVSWNFIRLASAEDFGRSIAANCSLRVLNLSHNSFGDLGTQLLGASLKTNKVLKDLDISYNSMIPRSATVLANALSHNDTLTSVNLNGNVIGRIGMMSLVAAIQRSSGEQRVLKVSFENCDCKKVDNSCFNASNPNGTWVIELDNPYGQMVMEECIYIANYRAGCNIVSLTYDGTVIELERKRTIKEKGKYPLDEFHAICSKAAGLVLQGELKEAAELLKVLMHRQFQFSFPVENGRSILECLHGHWFGTMKNETEDLHDVFLFEVFHALFQLNDADLSGSLELEEFAATLESLGKSNFDKDVLRRLMAEHDIDDSGTIDANEFAMIMVPDYYTYFDALSMLLSQ